MPMPDVPEPPRSDLLSLDALAGDAVAPRGPPPPLALPSDSLTDKLHLGALVDFVNADGFGYARDREHVAGFLSHRMSSVPALPTEQWLTRRVELVSLLKHDEPMVYVSKYLPNMDQLREAPVRPLDAFEQRTLAKLRTGDDVIVESGSDRIRMLGSLRAGKQCLECHSVERGALLGAFSYELIRDPNPPIRRDDKQRDGGVL